MNLNGKKVLVTGAAGLVGSNLILRLVREGASVRGTIHQRRPADSDDRVDYVTCDLTLPEDCNRIMDGVRYVFHCACKSMGAAARDTLPMSYVSRNLVMNTQMLEAAYGARVEKFVWLGSTTAYPLSGHRRVKEEEILEGDPYPAYFFVGWEKRFMEILCKMYGEKLPKAITTIVLRPTNIYGPNDNFDPATSRVTAALIRKVIERHDPLEVWGMGEEIRDHIYVDDVVQAMLMALDKINSYVTLNVGSGKGHSVKDVLQTILEIERYDNAKIVFDPSKPTMIPIRLVDTTQAEAVLGFTAKTNLREGLQKTIDWYKKSRIVGD